MEIKTDGLTIVTKLLLEGCYWQALHSTTAERTKRQQGLKKVTRMPVRKFRLIRAFSLTG